MALSQMMQHYLTVKDKYKDCFVFYRLGDFYEMFFDDAIKASAILDLKLTGRDCGLEERAPMCGVPFHAADFYISTRFARRKSRYLRTAYRTERQKSRGKGRDQGNHRGHAHGGFPDRRKK